MNWRFRKGTRAARKLLKDWEHQGLQRTQRITYLVKAHSIAPELVINTDQTRIHLVPAGGARTWAEKGSKHVQILGMEDKRQITISVSSSTAWNLLPFQLVFTWTTNKYLPPRNEGRQMCEDIGWHLTYSINHWSNLTTCKQFVEQFLQPYRRKQMQEMGLDEETKLIWLLECWSVHISKDFISWLKISHPNILLIFVLTNCINVFSASRCDFTVPIQTWFQTVVWQLHFWKYWQIDWQKGIIRCKIKYKNVNT